LVSRVLAGDGRAYSALVARYANVLSSTAFLMVRNTEDVRDIVQEAFVAAYCDLDQLETPRSFGAWIRAIVLNRCRKVLDRRTRTQRFLERLPQTAETSDPMRELSLKENARQVLQALETLDELHREVVMLYYFEDMKVDGIALLVGRPAGTIKRVLSEARGRLREELVDMAREEFPEYHLTDEQRRRLDMIPVFPREEPKIATIALAEEAASITAAAPHGNFPALHAAAEARYADYDWPGRKLTSVTHVRVEGPFEIMGRQALRYDDLSFSPEGKPEWIWRPYYCVEDDTVLYCAKQCGTNESSPLIARGQPDWGEPLHPPESLRVVPGSSKDPEGELNGSVVDANLWEVHVGRRSFRCIRRVTGGGKEVVEWSDVPVSGVATEEFFLTDGRMLLWRRYNGLRWSARSPGRKEDAPGTYELLEEAGVPALEIFGDRYYLWYDQIPDYAVGRPRNAAETAGTA
jgi:RNA polymerase sigma-70 factor (ECF subfamily)